MAYYSRVTLNHERVGIFTDSMTQLKGIHPKAAEVHGLTAEKLSSAPPLQIVMASFMEFVGSSPLVAHNASFDLRLLQQDLEECVILLNDCSD